MVEQQVTVRPAKAAEMLDVSYGQIKKMLAAGELASFRVGAMRLIRVDDLRAWAETRAARQ